MWVGTKNFPPSHKLKYNEIISKIIGSVNRTKQKHLKLANKTNNHKKVITWRRH